MNAGAPALNTSQKPDEAVALAPPSRRASSPVAFRTCAPGRDPAFARTSQTFGGLMNVIIPRNSTIPVKAGEAFTTAVDHQKDMLIHVLQGERERAATTGASVGLPSGSNRPARACHGWGLQFGDLTANGHGV